MVATYKDAKPQVIAFMLFALKEMKYLKDVHFKNKTQLHEALQNSFGEIGTRQALNSNIEKCEAKDDYLKAQIKTHQREIQQAVTKK